MTVTLCVGILMRVSCTMCQLGFSMYGIYGLFKAPLLCMGQTMSHCVHAFLQAQANYELNQQDMKGITNPYTIWRYKYGI